MLMGGKDKKAALEIVIAMGKKKPFSDRKENGYSESEVSKEEPDTEYSEYTAMAEEMMSAFENKDTEALASILKAYHSMSPCGDMGEMGEE